MLTTQLLSDVRLVLSAMDAAQPLFAMVSAFADVQRQVDVQVARFADGANDRRVDAGNNIHSQFASAAQHLKGRTLRAVFAAANSLVDALRHYAKVADSSGALTLAKGIQAFEEILDTFSTSHSISDAVLMLSISRNVNESLLATKSSLEDLARILGLGQIEPDQEAIVIVLEGEHSLTDIWEKLRALDEICTMLSGVLNESGLAVAFRLSKVESGSLSIALVAEKLGILALRRLLSGGFGYWYRNYTREGKLKFGLPMTSAALKDAIKMRNLLEKEGIDVARIDEALASQAEQFVQAIGRLAGHHDGARVDENAYASNLEPDHMQLSYAEPKRIGLDSDAG